MTEPENGSMADVVVVYEQQEHYVQAAIEPNEGVNVDLLQCQILSLVGLLPEEQILVTSRGEIISSPFSGASMALPSLPVSVPGQRERVFLTKAATVPDVGQRVPPDWREICTRCTFGDLLVVQPAFRTVGGGDSDALVCDLAMVSPLDWRSSKKLATRFISELLVVAGEPDVPASPGFAKVAGDLNYSASGDFVHLFVKRGGTRALTQLHVTHQPRGEQEISDASAAAIRLPVDCNSGNASDVAVLLSYDSIAASQSESLATYAITDVMLLVGESKPPESFIKIQKNLNEGCLGSEAVFLAYKLAPLGGFVCTPTHGAFGECLFQSRHAVGDRPPHAVTPAGCSPQSDTVLASLDSARERADNAFLQDHYHQHEPGMRSRLQGGVDRVKTYEDPRVQAEALKRIPVETLHERARANPTPLPSYQDELVMQLTHWFKREFFTWMNQPKCSVCANEKTRIVRTDPPSTPEEKAGQAGRVEVYQCSQCQGLTRFPRYNDPVKLLDTRVGRCGEWANCFTLCCRAMGFEARYVLDVTDHVWTEIYSEHHKRWLHCDSCEDQLDRPLTYEVGWGKKLSYIFSFSHEEVVDAAQRYTQNWDDMKLRRSEVSEPWLASTIEQMNQGLRLKISPDRIRVLDQRTIQERAELSQGRTATAEEVQGRVSGSNEWKIQRQEDGSTRDGDKGAPTVFRHLRQGNDTPMPIAELLQTLVKRMFLGCDRGSDCKNPSCLHKRSLLTPELSPTDRAALALQEAAVIQSKNFSVYGLASLLCPPADSIQDFVLSQDVRAYLPLQDSETNGLSSTVVDISGNRHHAQSTGPLRKPFRVVAPADDTVELAFGLQLLPGRRLTVPIPAMDRFTISWLVRFDAPPFEAASINGGIALLIDIGGESASASVRVRDEGRANGVLVVEATSDDTLVKSTAHVKPGLYYHFSIVVDQGVTVFVNAKQVVRTESKTQDHFSSIAFQSPAPTSQSKLPSSPVPVICHVAVLADVGEQTIQSFNETVKQRYVCWPPLQAYDASGVRTDKTCHQPEATLQSGYRVCRVRMWGSEFFDGIQLVYEKSNDSRETVIVEGPLVGNRIAHDAAQSPTVEFVLLPHEYLAGMAGRKGAWTDSILLETNFGRRFACGGNGGSEFHIDLSPHTMAHAVQIRAIQFDVGDHLVDAIAFVAEAPVAKEDETNAELRRILETVDTPKQTLAINAVTRYLDNIAASPDDPKFQKIRASNKFFSSSMGALAVAEQKSFMKWCGFEAVVEAGDTFYVYQPTTASSDATIRLHYLKTFTTNK